MGFFTLGADPLFPAIDPLLVFRFTGFDYPALSTRVRLLSDGTSTEDEVLQGSGVPFRDAAVTGHIAEVADLVTLRGYHLSQEAVWFRSGVGDETLVRVVELSVEDFTDWWTFSMTLIAIEPTLLGPATRVFPGPVVATLAVPVPAVTFGALAGPDPAAAVTDVPVPTVTAS